MIVHKLLNPLLLTLIFGHSPLAAAVAAPDTSFYITHNVANNGDTFTIKCASTGVYDAVIDWGDGTQSTITAWNDADLTHTYATAGRYSARITGTLERLNFDASSNSAKLVSITGGPASVGVDQILVSGPNTLSQDIADFPRSVTVLYFSGSNRISGNLAGVSRSVTYLYVTGFTTLGGNLADAPAGMTYLLVSGLTTIGGNLADAPAGMTSLGLYGSTTIGGDLADAPAVMTFLTATGNSTIGGNLSDAPAGMTVLILLGLSTVSCPTTTPWRTSSMDTVRLAANLTTSEVDNVLIMLANVTSWTVSKSVDLQEVGNAPRSSASDAAVATITSRGATVLTN